MEAISKSQNTHSEKLSLLLTFSEHTVAKHHLVPTRIPLKVRKGCQLLCAFTRMILEKCPFAEEFRFYWYAHRKFTVSPGERSLFVVIWPNVKIAVIEWISQSRDHRG